MTLTVPYASIACMAISGFIALVLPIVLFLILRNRFKARMLPMLVGAVSFVVFAMILERLVANVLMKIPAFTGYITSHWWAYALYVGLIAGLLEETGRLCAFYFVLRRKNNSVGGALAYGVGHGGIEAILLCTLTMAGNIMVSLTLNGSGVNGVLEAFSGQATGMELLASSAPVFFLAAGVERIIAIAFHMAASVLVWMAASGRGPWGLYFVAILFHAIVNFPAGLYQLGMITNYWLLEVIFAVLVCIVCIVTVAVYRKCLRNYTSLLQYEPVNFR